MASRQLQREINSDLRHEIERLQSQIRSAVNRQNTVEIERLARQMAEKAKEFEGKVKRDDVKVKMVTLNLKLKALSDDMKLKSDKMEFMGKEAKGKLRELLKESVKNGKAQLESLQ